MNTSVPPVAVTVATAVPLITTPAIATVSAVAAATAAGPSTAAIVKFVIITLVLGSIVFALSYLSETAEISNNWSQHRCDPAVMPFASFFGHDTTENFSYCMTYMFRGQAGQFLGPLLDVVSNVVSIFSTIVQSLSSIRLMIANIVNSAESVMSEMQNRILSVMLQLRMSLLRMKQLMYRLYATFYAIIFMGMSGMNAAVTFGNSTIGQFLDTFCFHPDTQVRLVCGTPIAMKDLRVGTEIMGPTVGTPIRITSKLSFDSRQQAHNMYQLDGIRVSGGHYVSHSGEWIQVKHHPNAALITWDVRTPLICFNTSTGTIPVIGLDGSWILFADYDEDRTVDSKVMERHEAILGPRRAIVPVATEYSLGIGSQSRIRMAQTLGRFVSDVPFSMTLERIPYWKSVCDIMVGDMTHYGRVLGIVEEECAACVRLRCGDLVSEAMMVWDNRVNGYVRAGVWTKDGTERAVSVKGARKLFNLIIDGNGILELKSGIFIRDYTECLSDTQDLYDSAMKNETVDKYIMKF